jgi:ArsR family transcriptional regulator
MESEYTMDAKVFKAFCDENRLQILELLRGGEKCACVLIEHMRIGQSALSYHMKILIESGVVAARQEGKWTHYSICESGAARAAQLLKQITTPNEVQDEPACCDQ